MKGGSYAFLAKFILFIFYKDFEIFLI